MGIPRRRSAPPPPPHGVEVTNGQCKPGGRGSRGAMGCASSNPLMQSGKNFVEAVTKGEQVIEDAGEAAKDGMEHVKEAVESAMATAESGLGSVVGKVNSSFASSARADANESAEGLGSTAKTSDGIKEAISEAETVFVSEVEEAKEAVTMKTEAAFEKMDVAKDEFGEAVKENLSDSLHIEDVEQSIDSLDSNYKDMKKKAENIVNGLPTPATTPPLPEAEDKKEEPPPTFWEAAADAILEQRRIRPSVDLPDSDIDLTLSDSEVPGDADLETQYDPESDTELAVRLDDYRNKEFMRPPEIIINSETLSVKSYKSEI